MLIISNKQLQVFDDYLLRQFAAKTARQLVEKLPLDRDPEDPEFVEEVLMIVKNAQSHYFIESKNGLVEFVFNYYEFAALRQAEQYPGLMNLLRNPRLQEVLKLEQLLFRLKTNSVS